MKLQFVLGFLSLGVCVSAVGVAQEFGFGDGMYIVGKDIQAGTYRTRGGSGCYWARLRGFGGESKNIIANRASINGSSQIVQIDPTDQGFQTENCGTWSASLTRMTETKNQFGDGMYIVGLDIDPGLYETSGGSGCYWARLRGFGGEGKNIIANRASINGSSQIVQIDPTDRGFQTENCGTWSASWYARLGRPNKSQNQFGDGTYIVGKDINPGVYKNSGGSDCYWVRLRGFGGEGKNIIANRASVNGSLQIVQIDPTDQGFQTENCGTWTRQ